MFIDYFLYIYRTMNSLLQTQRIDLNEMRHRYKNSKFSVDILQILKKLKI